MTEQIDGSEAHVGWKRTRMPFASRQPFSVLRNNYVTDQRTSLPATFDLTVAMFLGTALLGSLTASSLVQLAFSELSMHADMVLAGSRARR